MTEHQTTLFRDLTPVLMWLHSKKHDEKNLEGQWHRAWDAHARLLYWASPDPTRALEHAVHDAIGIPTENCQCEVCHG